MRLTNPFGPIFEKELRTTSRRKRSYLLRVVYLGGLLLFLVFAYAVTSAGGGWAGPGGVAWRVQRQNQLGQTFFGFFTVFSVGAMSMIAPILTCTAISSERLHKTLHVLLMTPIGAWQIITGKLFSRLLVALTLIGLSLPVLALVRLLGGVEVAEMFAAVALCTSVAVFGASLGLFYSTFVNRPFGTILFSFGTMLFLYIGLPMLMLSPYISSGPPPWQVFRAMGIVSPVFCTAFLVLPGAPTAPMAWWWCPAMQVGLAVICVALSASMLRRMQRREGAARAGVAASYETASDSPGDADTPTPQAAPRRISRRRRVGNNPVLWRELARPLFNRRWQSIAGGIFGVSLLLVSYGLMWDGDVLGDEELQFVYGCLFNAVWWLVLSVLAATAIAQEKESNTWTLLLTTPLRGTQVVLGKVFGVWRRMFWPILLIAGHFSMFALAGVISWVTVLLILWVIVSFNSVWLASGVLLSLLVRNVTLAVILNLMIVVVLYVVLPILLAIGWIMLDLPDEVGESLWWASPYSHIIMAVEFLSPTFTPTQTHWGPGRVEVTELGLVRAGLLAGAIHLLIAGGLVVVMVKGFDWMVGRAEQLEDAPPDTRDVSRASATT